MNDISVDVDDFKDANEALENQVEVCNDEKVKTKPVNVTFCIVIWNKLKNIYKKDWVSLWYKYLRRQISKHNNIYLFQKGMIEVKGLFKV